jgi:lipopolysaccharide biosynthesis glycosyltransferase
MRRRIAMHWLMLTELKMRGLYHRPFEYRKMEAGNVVMWDEISDAPQSTEHANSRFLVRALQRTGWALFTDCDVLFRADVNDLFDGLDPAKALYCVQHDYDPVETAKMDGQIQTRYARKNWTSVMAINCDHPANEALTVEMINTLPGRDLHRLCWLDDADIGALDPAWNHLVGVNQPNPDAKIVHFTLGTPNMPECWDCEFAAEWQAELIRPTGATPQGA